MEGETTSRSLVFTVLIVMVALVGVVEASVSHVSEQCGKWTASFNWSDTDGYKKSVSQADNDDNKVKKHTDTLTLTSNEDPRKAIKISIIKYSKWNSSLAKLSNLMDLANNTLVTSGSCKGIQESIREIDGKTGVIAGGLGCNDGMILYDAVYCIDGSSRAIPASTLAVILSSYDQDSTDRLVNSVHIE